MKKGVLRPETSLALSVPPPIFITLLKAHRFQPRNRALSVARNMFSFRANQHKASKTMILRHCPNLLRAAARNGAQHRPS
jgi:hypothetical protein